MRILVKGGIWKNTEDEILKAAVSKYGKNQWARISSLLVRKTAKQCKARWFEWLDPSIRKTEWSKDEDERLLHLAKLMPTQWRTIAPIVGRTPSQCLERYQKLLDDAEQQAGSELGLTGVGDSGPSADDVRRLRPGEIDPDPETKPARPDPVDMDEDEKEMLSEARARLANTQGKKAKRKAREKQLEEARRLASLQKRRELKAAGIETKSKKKIKGMDYNADIPFEARPAPGFYDVSDELKRKPTKKLTDVRLEQLDGKRRSEAEEEERKKDAKRQKQRKESGETSNASTMAQLKKLQEAEQDGIIRRKKLVLPSPHVGEAELEDILKIGSVADDARALAQESENDATRNLVGNYNKAGQALPMRTPRATTSQNPLLIEALNQRAMLAQQTPLLGGETPTYNLQSGTGYGGINPKQGVPQTPNPYLQTPARGGLSGSTPMRTPLRDEFNINTGRTESVMATPREDRLRQAALRQQLLAGLSDLPAPKNQFEIQVPTADMAALEVVDIEEDAADIAARRKAAFEAEEEARLARRSLAVQKDLPRPTAFHEDYHQTLPLNGSTDDSIVDADRLIREELAHLVKYDSVAYPPPGSKVPGGTAPETELETISDDYLALARAEIEQELTEENSVEKYEAFSKNFDAIWDNVQREMNKLRSIPLSEEFSGKRNLMTKHAAQANKMEKRLGITLGGLQARSQSLATQLIASHEDLLGSELELECFQNLRIMEQSAAERRTNGIKDEVTSLAGRESQLQQKWSGLNQERQEILARIEKLHAQQQQ